MTESPEYLMRGVISVPLQSLVYSVKRTGAKTVPCGAPVDVQSWDESTDWKRTNWVLFSKKCTIQNVNLGSTFRQRSFFGYDMGLYCVKSRGKIDKKHTNERSWLI